MNILVTGAGGFVGNHICNFFEKKSHKVFRIVRNPKNLPNEIHLDLTKKTEVENFVKNFAEKIDIVIHLAAKMAHALQSTDEQMQGFNDNIEITKNVILLVDFLKPKKLINFSSMAVYPNIDGEFNEDSAIKMSANNDCLYGLAKFCAENLFDYFLAKKNVSVAHLRIAQIYGEGMYQDRIMPVMKEELKHQNTITVYAEGSRVSNFISVHRLLGIIEYFVQNNIMGVYNVGGESLSYLELAQRIIAEFGDEKSAIIKKKEGSAGAKFYLNSDKLNKIIGN